MIYVHLISKSTGATYDITNACAKVEWSGDYAESGRRLSFDYLNAPYDPDLKLPMVACGDRVTAYLAKDAAPVFTGHIYAVERSSQIGTITYTAYDAVHLMTKSRTTKNFKNTSPEKIAALLCQEMGLEAGELYETKVPISSMLCSDMSYYDIIMAAYTKAHDQTGDDYFLYVDGEGRLCVRKAEWIVSGFSLSDRNNITESDIQESVDSIVNRVEIFSDANERIGVVQDDASISSYGVFQETYTQEEGTDANTAAAKQIYTKPAQSIRISAVGDVHCLAGYYVRVQDGATGLTGKYFIKSDTHTWENGVHQMELDIAFDSIMRTVESSDEEET